MKLFAIFESPLLDREYGVGNKYRLKVFVSRKTVRLQNGNGIGDNNAGREAVIFLQSTVFV